MKIAALFIACEIVALLTSKGCTKEPEINFKPRTIVTTDGEVDDMDSFIRLLLYSNELQLEGLIYSSSMWHYSGDGMGTSFVSEMPMTRRIYGERTELRWPGTTWMQELIGKYADIFENLLLHDTFFPDPEYLKSIIRVGNIEFEGEMSKDTEGSDFIRDILLDDNDAPVYLQIWGGTNTLARALKSIEDTYRGGERWEEIYTKVSEKTVLYIIMDQDATFRNYIQPVWPGIRTICNGSLFGSLAYWWYRAVRGPALDYLGGAWFAENIKFKHGPLLENYYLWGDGQRVPGDPEHTQGDPANLERENRIQYDFLSEGDSPAFLHLLDFGLDNLEDPSRGGLGGRFTRSDTAQQLYVDGDALAEYNPYTASQDPAYSQVRWIPALQNDFAARGDWCVKSFQDANHAPRVEIRKNRIQAAPGKRINLAARAKDPDGNTLTYRWWNYAEAGNCPEEVIIENENEKSCTVSIPVTAVAGQTIHMILEVTDKGTPPLTRYQRVVLEII